MVKSLGVVGGGLAGLAAALRLANKGFRVQLFEQSGKLGGKMNEVVEQGYRFDTGPSLLTMPFVIDELFQFLGLKRSDYLNFKEIDPICRYFWQEGLRLDAHVNFEPMRDAIRTISAPDAERYKNFLLYSKAIYNLTADVFLYTAVHEWKKLANRNTLRKLLRIREIDPWRTVDQGVRRFFSDPHIIQIFNRYATYNGSDPYRAPATLNIIPYVEYVLGSFYIEGGIYRLVEQLSDLAGKLGIEIHLNTPVEKILHHNRKISGLQVAGQKIELDYVVCNGDVVTSFVDLIDGFSRETRKLRRLEPSLSGIVFLWGLNKGHQQLVHHNIFFSADYRSEFRCLFNEKCLPDDPTIYVAITSKSDGGHAPSGKENWFVLCNMPYLDEQNNGPGGTEIMRSRILDKLKTHGIDIESSIEYEQVITPRDFYVKYKSNRGSIYGLSSNSRFTAFRRPANRNRRIKGLYFAGGSAHPGGGIPLVLLSGKLSSDLILEREGLKQ